MATTASVTLLATVVLCALASQALAAFPDYAYGQKCCARLSTGIRSKSWPWTTIRQYWSYYSLESSLKMQSRENEGITWAIQWVKCPYYLYTAYWYNNVPCARIYEERYMNSNNQCCDAVYRGELKPSGVNTPDKASISVGGKAGDSIVRGSDQYIWGVENIKTTRNYRLYQFFTVNTDGRKIYLADSGEPGKATAVMKPENSPTYYQVDARSCNGNGKAYCESW